MNIKLVTRLEPTSHPNQIQLGGGEEVTRSNLGQGKVEPQLFCFFRFPPSSAAHLLAAQPGPAQKSHPSALADTLNQTVMEMLLINMILMIVM